jgi:hypothetical protein
MNKTNSIMKYVIANIKIPIEILPNNTTNPLINRSEIEFSNCDELPPEQSDQNAIIIQKLSQFLNNVRKPTDNPPVPVPTPITEQEIKIKYVFSDHEEPEQPLQQPYLVEKEETTAPLPISFSPNLTPKEKEHITNLFITKTELENKQHHPRSHTLTFKNNPRLQKVRKFTAKVREIPSI